MAPDLDDCAPATGVVNVSTSWAQITMPFHFLTEGSATFDKSELTTVTFHTETGPYDFWIDDVTLY